MGWDRRLAGTLNRRLPGSFVEWMYDVSLGNVARGSDDAAFDARMEEVITKTLDDDERAVLDADSVARKEFKECTREAARQGSKGAVLDAKLVLSEWGFDLRDVKGKVRIWNGSEDRHVPASMARWIGERIGSSAEVKVFEGEGMGHVGMVVRHRAEILEELCGLGR